MIFRAILAGIFVFLASFVNASQYCEQILKEDFREESKSSHLFQDGGIVLHSETPVIYKVRDGSVASDLHIKPGDRIIRVNNKLLSNIETIAFNQISRILATPTKQDIILHIQNKEYASDISDLLNSPLSLRRAILAEHPVPQGERSSFPGSIATAFFPITLPSESLKIGSVN